MRCSSFATLDGDLVRPGDWSLVSILGRTLVGRIVEAWTFTCDTCDTEIDITKVLCEVYEPADISPVYKMYQLRKTEHMLLDMTVCLVL